MKLEQIVGFTFPNNTASWRVLEKVGMRYVGLARYPDVVEDVKKYIADRRTWLSNPSLTSGSKTREPTSFR